MDQQENVVTANNDVIEAIIKQPIEKKQEKSIPSAVVDNAITVAANSAIAFDELGEWTDAKPDRKKGKDKKKSRKD